ncbi:hypothetical protein PEL8287_01075 [Roseovarius litorisediminis]|uniref:Uncharacterized protein n=1 Tax=Roseovarius litorisediminis TaxID=1312363 RepID=A0A1Y5RTD7_9RHOB|nr:hypothetical protein PEL8287_01075 [Roseovarius litorisediminis]
MAILLFLMHRLKATTRFFRAVRMGDPKPHFLPDRTCLKTSGYCANRKANR